ncbi:MAG: hypothetical protein IJ344_03595, partial [Clostridia bacterium]|nr:hypothetical protein [Clostridia bacterium]
MSKYKTGALIFGLMSVGGALCFSLLLLLAQLGVFTPDRNETIELVIVADSAEKTYDGTPLYDDGYTVKRGNVLKGHTLQVTVYGEQLTAGTGENKLSVAVFDEYGRDVTDIYYKLTLEYGDLTVHKRALTLRSESVKTIYDGVPLAGEKIYTLSGEMAPGHRLQTSVVETLNTVGYADNRFVARILSETGEDLSANYQIEYIYGALQVLPLELIINTEGAEKTYDGQPLFCAEYSYDQEMLLTGHRLFIEMT